MSSHIICPKQKEYSRVSTHKELNQFISIVKSKKALLYDNKQAIYLLAQHSYILCTPS
jgi:hypothetical protein